MKTLPIYKDFPEKSKNFKLLKIETINEFNDFLAEQKDKGGIYRGIGSASYKIYTSLQRQIIENELTGFDVKQYVNNVRTNPILEKYFKTFKIPASKLSVYSYLQHYGAPSPYLDFTYNINTALFFATERFDITKFHRTGTIDDYISIFYIKQSDLDIIDVKRVIESLKKIKELSNKLFLAYKDDNDGFTQNDFDIYLDKFIDLNTCEVFLMNYNEELADVYNTLNNIRIIAQDGLFIHNGYSHTPLEEALKKFYEQYTRYQPSLVDAYVPGEEELEAEYLKGLEEIRTFHKRLQENIITSIEINKAIIPEIVKLINLTRDEIYPEPEVLCKQMFDKSK